MVPTDDAYGAYLNWLHMSDATRAVAAYWERMQQRPAYQKAMAIQHQAALDQGVLTTPSPDIRPGK